MYSDNTIDSVNSEVEKFIAAGYKRAEEIINSHRDLLDAIVEELLVKHIMSEEQLDEVCRRFLPQEQEQV